MQQADLLLADIWATGPASPVPAHLMRALAHSGNYVAGAWAGTQLVGASVAVLAWHDGSVGLHSHVTGVVSWLRGTHVGLALKLHQRAWALERGIDEIGWSFDPLIRRNAWFNLKKLGAEAVAYEPDFYGSMTDGINAGDMTDRCLVRWALTASDVMARCEGLGVNTDGPDPPGTRLLDEGRDGYPVVTSPTPPGDEPVQLCRVPADIEGWRQAQPERARAWRLALRHTLGIVMAAGFVARTMTRDGCYVLTRPNRGAA
jgi:predicted GNAT superfamily acetyltransferase